MNKFNDANKFVLKRYFNFNFIYKERKGKNTLFSKLNSIDKYYFFLLFLLKEIRKSKTFFYKSCKTQSKIHFLICL